MLKKTSIYLDERLDQGLARKAAAEGVTKAELIRQTLDASLDKPKRPKAKGLGMIKNAPRDLGRNAEKYLDGMGES
jgi:hypothetical protein